MKINSFNQQQFSGIVARETNKPAEDIQKETFSFSTEDNDLLKADQLVNYFRMSGGMNVAADAVVETCSLQGINYNDDTDSKQVVDMAIMNAGAVALITRDILSPLCPNVISGSVLYSGAKKVDENVISVDLNAYAGDANAGNLFMRDFIENEPSYRVYIGTDVENKGGFVYADKLK